MEFLGVVWLCMVFFSFGYTFPSNEEDVPQSELLFGFFYLFILWPFVLVTLKEEKSD